MSNFMEYISKNFELPKDKDFKGGRVIASFVVDTDGDGQFLLRRKIHINQSINQNKINYNLYLHRSEHNDNIKHDDKSKLLPELPA